MKKHGWFVSRTFVVYHELFFSKYLYIFVRVSVILIQKKWEIERQLRYVSMLNLSFDLCKKSYYLILLVLRWIILYLILENDLLFSRNQVFCFKKWKLVEALIQVEFIIFLWNFAHVFSSQCLQNYFLLCFAVLTKNQKTFFFESRRNQVFLLFPWYLPSEENTIPICTCRHFQGKQMCKFSEKSKLDLSYSFQKLLF